MIKPLTYANIYLDRLCRNYAKIREYAETPLICVSKANSYGHGASLCVPALYGAGARFFAAANSFEALELRGYLTGKKNADIIILGVVSPEDVPELIENDIILALSDAQYASELRRHIPDGKRLRVHIKLDTGMNRIGFDLSSDSSIDEIAAIAGDEKFSVEGVFTHFACADEPDAHGGSFTRKQLERYNAMLAALASRGIDVGMRHARNSAAALCYPETKFDTARAGIILYGLTPSEELSLPLTLEPVMELCTTITHIHTLRAGESVSYGADYTAGRDMPVATLAVGYADGYIRAYRGATVRIHGVDCPIIGRICMDQCMCDISAVNDAAPGDEALLFGADKPVERLAELAGTINYECVCLIGRRVPRISYGDAGVREYAGLCPDPQAFKKA